MNFLATTPVAHGARRAVLRPGRSEGQRGGQREPVVGSSRIGAGAPRTAPVGVGGWTLEHQKKMESINLVEENQLLVPNENIQSASHLQKPHG